MTISRIPSVEGGIQPTLLTAKGDLISATAASTVARLAVGSDAQILVADSTASTGLKWATAASGNFTLVSRTSFSNVASQAFDNVFTSTYKSYQIVIEDIFSTTTTDDLQMQFRYAGPTTQTSAYYEQYQALAGGAATLGNVTGANEITLNTFSGLTTYGTPTIVDVFNVSGSSARAAVVFQSHCLNNNVAVTGGGSVDTARIYTGFLLKSASTNITGTVAVYGRN